MAQGRVFSTRWMPKEKEATRAFVKLLMKEVKECKDNQDTINILSSKNVTVSDINKLTLHEPIKDLCCLIITDPDMYMFFNQMFVMQRYGPDDVPDWPHFIVALDNIMTKGPVYSSKDLVALPINALLNWPMMTAPGYACFANNTVHEKFRAILNCWKTFLASEKSAYVLNATDSGWFCKDALGKMVDKQGRTFQEQFVCTQNDSHWGFKSWDAFFTRVFREDVRPIKSDGNEASAIVNPCESTTCAFAKDVNRVDQFWLKGQPYSISHMLNSNSRWVDYFVGGTVYQAYLSCLGYHRFHSPVTGTIREVQIIDGAYYSTNFETQDDPAAPDMNQSFLAQIAARVAIYIESDNRDIGTVCMLLIGMTETSSVEMTTSVDQQVSKGEQLGMFHYGGSTFCLMFRPGIDVTLKYPWTPGAPPVTGPDSIVQLRDTFATISKKK